MKASILFISYNHAQFVGKAIRSALAQDYPEIELVVCDDASPDETCAILEWELENGPPNITFVRSHSEQNVGLIRTFNRGIAACSGEIIVPMAGDDISLPHRVSMICEEFSKDPKCMLVCSDWIQIDTAGGDYGPRLIRKKNEVFSYSPSSVSIYAKAPVCGATAAYRATLRDLFPPMQKGSHAEDNCFWFRALLVGNIRYISDPLIHWRSHGNSQSNWVRDGDTKDARVKHLRFLYAHQCMGKQWIQDLCHALESKLVTFSEFERLRLMALFSRESYRIRRYFITPAPWQLWLGSVSKLLRVNFSWWSFKQSLVTIAKHLKIRLFAKHRQKYWIRYFTKNTRSKCSN